MEDINRIIAKVLIAQSNKMLDCIEGKVSILEATSLFPAKATEIDKLRARLKRVIDRKELTNGKVR